MISHICGKLVQKKDLSVILDVNGIFYEVFLPGAVMSSVDSHIREDAAIKLVTFHYHQIEPSRATPVLIGFLNEIEKEFFEKFITVSGIGPRAAVKALNIPFSQVAKAIDEADKALLKSLPGIGEQRAKEIIAKLQGKVGKYALIQDGIVRDVSVKRPDFAEEALDVLIQLQYKKHEAKEMIDKALKRSSDIGSVEELLNEVYRQRTEKQKTLGDRFSGISTQKNKPVPTEYQS
jgi:Holliday junction DNA helicase RuvA